MEGQLLLDLFGKRQFHSWSWDRALKSLVAAQGPPLVWCSKKIDLFLCKMR